MCQNDATQKITLINSYQDRLVYRLESQQSSKPSVLIITNYVIWPYFFFLFENFNQSKFSQTAGQAIVTGKTHGSRFFQILPLVPKTSIFY